MRWHHLPCAAQKLPAELKDTLDKYPGEVPDRAELEKKMAEALAGGHAKPAGFPYADKAPTGRARCLQCREPIDKDALRVAIERELDTGTMVTRGAGYLHPKCVGAYVEATSGDKAALVDGVRANSRLVAEDLAKVVAEIG